MKQLVVRSPEAEERSKVVSLRFTPSEYKEISELSDALHFKSVRDLIVFSCKSLKMLKNWQDENLSLYVAEEDSDTTEPVEYNVYPEEKSIG